MMDLHIANIAVHVISGTIAILLGLAQLFTRKGSPAHRQIGRAFLLVFSVVIVTAIIGLTVFEFRAFLAVIVLVSGYQALSGFRSILRQDAAITNFDQSLSLVALGAGLSFLIYIENAEFPWDQTVIYSTLGWLALVAVYDLLRPFYSNPWNIAAAPYEHLTKLIGAFSALLSAFAGTVLPQAQPLSQLLPSVLGVLLILFFGIKTFLKPATQDS